MKRKKTIIILILIFIFIFICIGTLILNLYMNNSKSEIYKTINSFKKNNTNKQYNFIEDENTKTFYVSSTGTSNEGISPEDPMSLESALKKTYSSNQKILLKAGDTFYGKVSFNIKLTDDNKMCYIGKYGEGNMPIISGAKIVSRAEVWEKYSNDIYKINLTNLNNFYGVNSCDENSCMIGFIRTEDGKIFGGLKKKISDLSNDFDFYCDGQNLFLKSFENPINRYGKLYLATKTDLLCLSRHVEVENLHVKDTGAHGIVKRQYQIFNTLIHNCIVENIGGSYNGPIESDSDVRYGNGIELWNTSYNVDIENNIIRNVYDAGITIQGNQDGFSNINIRNNIIINTCYSFELWGSKKSEGLDNVNVTNNISINEGKGWAQSVRPNPYNSANFVLYSFADTAKMNINIYSNKFLNSERQFYVLYTIKDRFKKEMKIDNNTYYYDDQCYYVNNSKNGELKEYLNSEYNIEKNSDFYLIDDKEQSLILNTDIMNSNDYNQIVDYYKQFENNYRNRKNTNGIIKENINVYNSNNGFYNNEAINTKYNSLIENLNNLPSQTTSITKDTINSIYNQQYELINTIVDEFNDKKINISESEYQTLVTELLNISEQYKELFNTYITEDDIENSTVEDNINNVIDRYNENKDIDMTMCAELINNIKEIYNDKIQTEETSYNYLNKRRIQNTCTIISKVLENKIKETAQQEAQKIGIAYNIDPSTLTNKDVIAQIKLPNSKSSIESNPNNEKYTFTENGTKNITINIRGYKYNYNIKVTNIDKTPPQINGIEQSGKYKESATPQITDENLSEVKLIKDGQEVENYKQNTAITQEGIYQLKATDKAGNETSINFVIAYPEDEKYKIENNTIKNIKGETSVEILKGKLQVDEKYTIKRKDTEIQNSENIATGDILETESGNKYTLIVRGDLNKDGKVDIKDLVKMRKFLLLGNNLDESEEMAADTNIDGKEISIKDLVKMRIILLTQ